MNKFFDRDLLLKRLLADEPAPYFVKQAREYIIELEERLLSAMPRVDHVAQFNKFWAHFNKVQAFYIDALESGDQEKQKAAANTCIGCFKSMTECQCVGMAASG